MKTMKPTETSELLVKPVEKANTIARNLIMKRSRGTGVSKTTTLFQKLKLAQVSAQPRCADSIKELRKRSHSKLDADNRLSFCFVFGWTIQTHSKTKVCCPLLILNGFVFEALLSNRRTSVARILEPVWVFEIVSSFSKPQSISTSSLSSCVQSCLLSLRVSPVIRLFPSVSLFSFFVRHFHFSLVNNDEQWKQFGPSEPNTVRCYMFGLPFT
jgi:hypothetical protein